MVELKLRRGLLNAILWGVPLFLILIALGRDFIVRAWGTKTFAGQMQLLAIESEYSFANWYSAILMAFISLVLGFTALTEATIRWRRYWFALAAIFLFLSADEALGIHELLSVSLADQFTGPLQFAWIVIYGPVTLVLAVIFVPFVFHLPPVLRWSAIIGGACYVGSAVGPEMVESQFHALFGPSNPYFHSAMKLQELGEIVGLTIFVSGLFRWHGFLKCALNGGDGVYRDSVR